MSALDEMIEQVESKYPAVCYRGSGSRAQEAAEYIRRQMVECLGEQGGRDRWRVGDHVCSIRGGCSCLDSQAPLDSKGRKLCKHRIAATFAYKLRQLHGLVPLLESVPGDRVTLTVQVLYADNGRQYTLSGWRYPGGEAVALPYEDRIRFTEQEFSAALRIAGWGMADRPVRGNAMTYRYILHRGVEIACDAGDTTAEDMDAKTQRAHMREITVANEMHAELAAEEAA